MKNNTEDPCKLTPEKYEQEGNRAFLSLERKTFLLWNYHTCFSALAFFKSFSDLSMKRFRSSSLVFWAAISSPVLFIANLRKWMSFWKGGRVLLPCSGVIGCFCILKTAQHHHIPYWILKRQLAENLTWTFKLPEVSAAGLVKYCIPVSSHLKTW